MQRGILGDADLAASHPLPVKRVQISLPAHHPQVSMDLIQSCHGQLSVKGSFDIVRAISMNAVVAAAIITRTEWDGLTWNIR